MTEFLHMGGYAAFVWPAYAIAAIMLVWTAADSLFHLKANARLLAELEARLPGPRGTEPAP